MCVFPCVPDDNPSPTTTALPLSYYTSYAREPQGSVRQQWSDFEKGPQQSYWSSLFTSAQLTGTIAIGAVIAESVRLRSCKQWKGWTGAERPNKLYHLLHTVLLTKRVTTQQAASTAARKLPECRPGVNGARPTHSPRNQRLQPEPRWHQVNSQVGTHHHLRKQQQWQVFAHKRR